MTSAISMSGSSAAYASLQTRSADTTKLQEQLFNKVDSNGDKSIDKTELSSFLSAVAEDTGTTAVDADSAFSALDSDGSGDISATELEENGSALFDQLRAQMTSSQLGAGGPPPGPPPSDSDSSDVFSSIDTDGDGAISTSELNTFLSSSQASDTDSTSSSDDATSLAEEILARDDTDGDGSISESEFEAAMKNRPEPPQGEQDGQSFEQMFASLVSQYTAISSGITSSTSTLSAAA